MTSTMPAIAVVTLITRLRRVTLHMAKATASSEK
jgi:hypothetical protein